VICRKHLRYQAKRQPRCTCHTCWQTWFYSPYNKTHATIRLIKLLADRDRVAMRDKQQETAAYLQAMK
jgi:hypothetical protein